MAVMALMGADPAAATQPTWFDAPYRYVAINQDVRSVLAEFGRNLQAPVVLSDAVRGRIQGEVRGETAGRFLNEVAEAGGLVWYFDGSILHVSASSEQATSAVETPGVEAATVERELRRLGLTDDRFGLRTSPDSKTIVVSGPPAYRSVVEQVARSVKPRPILVSDDPRVRVFRGGLPTETVEGDAGASVGGNRVARR